MTSQPAVSTWLIWISCPSPWLWSSIPLSTQCPHSPCGCPGLGIWFHWFRLGRDLGSRENRHVRWLIQGGVWRGGRWGSGHSYLRWGTRQKDIRDEGISWLLRASSQFCKVEILYTLSQMRKLRFRDVSLHVQWCQLLEGGTKTRRQLSGLQHLCSAHLG